MLRTSRVVAPLLLAPALAILAACATVAPLRQDALVVSGPTLGARELHADACYSGEHFVFLGAQVVDSRSQTEARLVIDPIEGPVVRLFASEHGDDASIVLRRKSCRVFETNLRRTGSWTNGVSEVDLELRLDCRTRRGDRVRGVLSQKACG